MNFNQEFSKANKMLREGNGESAIQVYRKLLEANNGVPVYAQNLVLALKSCLKYEEASRVLYKALAKDPKNAFLKNILKKGNQDYIGSSNGPLLTVIIPVYNSGKYLEQCLKSVLNQSFKDLELIIVNDGSTDNSSEIILNLESQDDRVRVITNARPSGNPGTPRNQALEIALGKYIGFVDSDDWIDSNFYKTLIDKAQEDASDIVFSGGFNNCKVDGVEVRKYQSSGFDDSESPAYKYHESFMIWDKIFNSKLIKCFGIKLGETKAAVDVPFVFKCYYYSQRVSFCDDLIGYNYRRESDSSVTVAHRKRTDCKFEFVAYESVKEWARSENVAKYYYDRISTKEVSSYSYTLSLIDPQHFFDFFARSQIELGKIDKDRIRMFSKAIGKPFLDNRYKDILGLSADEYYKKYRLKDNVGDKLSEVRELYIPGKNPGVIFFPDWIHKNPYLKLFYSALASRYNISVSGLNKKYLDKKLLWEAKDEYKYLHFHWLHNYIDVGSEEGAESFIAILDYAKSIGYKLIYTAHNIVSHESKDPDCEINLRKRILPYFDIILAHGNVARRRLIEEMDADESKVSVLPHGGYQGFYKNYLGQKSARTKLDIRSDDFVFLFFGNIREYKGVEPLIESFKKVASGRSNVKLLIAGNTTNKETEHYISETAQSYPNITYRHGYVDDDDVQLYMNAGNICVMPYTKILTSGAALLSLSFNTPVIAPKSGVIPEVVTDDLGFVFDNFSHMEELMTKCVDIWDKGDWHSRFEEAAFENHNRSVSWASLIKNSIFDQEFGSHIVAKVAPKPRKPYEYAIVRVIGNDLPFRHAENQSITNVEMMLEQESEFLGAKKLWILNRIIDGDKISRLRSLIESKGHECIEIPFSKTEYAAQPFGFDELPSHDFKFTKEYEKYDERKKIIVDTAILKHKNNYVMNNNGARNIALEKGAEIATWVFPWDGNCFITDSAWEQIKSGLSRCGDKKYHIVPMDRALENSDLLKEDYVPNATEEPQIIFRHDAQCRFDENLTYGLKPKVDLLKRLYVHGVWDKWGKLYPWLDHDIALEKDRFDYAWSGWVARLFSGNEGQEVSAHERAVGREKGICNYLQKLDVENGSTIRFGSQANPEFFQNRSITSVNGYCEKLAEEYCPVLVSKKHQLQMLTLDVGKESKNIVDDLLYFLNLWHKNAVQSIHTSDAECFEALMYVLMDVAGRIIYPLIKKFGDDRHVYNKILEVVSKFLDDEFVLNVTKKIYFNTPYCSFVFDRELLQLAVLFDIREKAYYQSVSVNSRLKKFVEYSIKCDEEDFRSKAPAIAESYLSAVDISQIAKQTLSIDMLGYKTSILDKLGNPLKIGLNRVIESLFNKEIEADRCHELARQIYYSTHSLVPFLRNKYAQQILENEVLNDAQESEIIRPSLTA